MMCLSVMRASFTSLALLALAACSSADSGSTAPVTTPGLAFKSNPCGSGGTVQLNSAQTARVDCSGGGTTVTLAGNGASYLVVPEFATDQVIDNLVEYTLASGSVASTSLSPNAFRASRQLGVAAASGALPRMRPMHAQLAVDRQLRAKGHLLGRTGSFRASANRLQQRIPSTRSASFAPAPVVGSIRALHVATSLTAPTFKTSGATMSFAGYNVLLYIDTLAPANGFTPAQLAAFGTYFDKTLYPIDTAAFGAPVDLDQNGHVIVLMSPAVNAVSPAAQCDTQGYVAGFFDPGDFDGPADPNSNQGEIFYTIVPDPQGTVSCAHSAASLGDDVPATFLHELQHLIYFSQHVIVSGTGEGSSWIDEGMSIVAEELGSLNFERKCPPPSCRTSPAQLFPDSSQGFIQGFLYDSYQFALLPDTASVTLHDDSEDGFSWRGGTWLMMRWLGDQVGTGIYKALERGPANGVANIEKATGQSFQSLFANFGMSLATDSLPGFARSTVPQADRFTSRNMKALWARLFATSGGAFDVPQADPVTLFPITSDTSVAVMSPGTMTYFRLDTPTSAPTVTIRFATPAGTAFPATLHPQMQIFRLPPGL